MQCRMCVWEMHLPFCTSNMWCLSRVHPPMLDASSSYPCRMAVLFSQRIRSRQDSYSKPTDTVMIRKHENRALSFDTSIKTHPFKFLSKCYFKPLWKVWEPSVAKRIMITIIWLWSHYDSDIKILDNHEQIEWKQQRRYVETDTVALGKRRGDICTYNNIYYLKVTTFWGCLLGKSVPFAVHELAPWSRTESDPCQCQLRLAVPQGCARLALRWPRDNRQGLPCPLLERLSGCPWLGLVWLGLLCPYTLCAGVLAAVWKWAAGWLCMFRNRTIFTLLGWQQGPYMNLHRANWTFQIWVGLDWRCQI